MSKSFKKNPVKPREKSFKVMKETKSLKKKISSDYLEEELEEEDDF